MKIVLDANIIIAALLGSRGKLTILTSQNHEFFVPKKILEEINKYEKLICSKLECTTIDFRRSLKALLFFIEIVEFMDYETFIEKIKGSMKDLEDIDYIACALHVGADFVWTEDKDFLNQNLVNVKTTEDFIEEGKY